MRRTILSVLLSAVLATPAVAEPVALVWREPTASGTLAFTTVYWCLGVACTTWSVNPPARCRSSSSNGGGAKKLVLQVPVAAGELPITVRLKVTATDTSENETPGVIATYTLQAP